MVQNHKWIDSLHDTPFAILLVCRGRICSALQCEEVVSDVDVSERSRLVAFGAHESPSSGRLLVGARLGTFIAPLACQCAGCSLLRSDSESGSEGAGDGDRVGALGSSVGLLGPYPVPIPVPILSFARG